MLELYNLLIKSREVLTMLPYAACLAIGVIIGALVFQPPPVDVVALCGEDRRVAAEARVMLAKSQEESRICKGTLAATKVSAEMTDCTKRVHNAVSECVKLYGGTP